MAIEITEQHLRWVRIETAKAYSMYGIASYKDMLQDAYLALVRASKRFDESKGFTFLSYATHRIQGALKDHARTYAGKRAKSPESMNVYFGSNLHEFDARVPHDMRQCWVDAEQTLIKRQQASLILQKMHPHEAEMLYDIEVNEKDICDAYRKLGYEQRSWPTRLYARTKAKARRIYEQQDAEHQ